MSLGRTILALLIAASVAALPAGRGVARTVKAADISMSAEKSMSEDMSVSEDMSMSEDMSDCCPKMNPCDQGMNDCGSMAGCPLNCFGLSSTSFSSVVLPSILASLTPPLASNPFRAQTSGPPFRPPRV
jgi:hypothetical protein